MFSTSQSQSQVSQGSKLQRRKSSSDQVIFIANFSRHLANVTKEGLLFHQALLVVTKKKKNQMNSSFEYHIVEYWNDSQVYDGKIVIDKIYKLKNLEEQKDLRNLTKFKEKGFDWEKISIKKQFDIDNLYITVRDIRQKMQQIANENGQYDLFSNNCQIVADKLTEQLLFDEIQNKNVIFLAYLQIISDTYEDGEQKQNHPALFVAVNNIQNHEKQSYYIIELLKDNEVQAYQFYFLNQPQDLENLKYFQNKKDEWEAQGTICKFYIQQTVENTINQLRLIKNVWSTFTTIQRIQEEEKLRQEQQSCQLI